MATAYQIEKLIISYGARVCSQGDHHVDVEIQTSQKGFVSVAIATNERRFDNHGFNPQGWTMMHYLAANAAMATLLALAEAIWDLCEVQS